MGLRVDLQRKIIALFKSGSFYIVRYDAQGLPEATEDKCIPEVVCNEVSASIAQKAGSLMGYEYTGWTFAVYLTFKKEVDFSEFILKELRDIIVNENNVLATAVIGNSVVVKHPPRQGSEIGTELQFNLSIKTRR